MKVSKAKITKQQPKAKRNKTKDKRSQNICVKSKFTETVAKSCKVVAKG